MLIRSQKGFTLVELMVTLVIAGIAVAGMFQLLVGFEGLSTMQTAQREAVQNSRAIVNMVSDEMRSVPGGAVMVAEESRFGAPVASVWGIACDLPTGSSIHIAVAPNDVPELGGGTWWVGVRAEDGSMTRTRVSSISLGSTLCEAAMGAESEAAFLRLNYAAGVLAGEAGDRVYVGRYTEYGVADYAGNPVRGRWVTHRRTASGDVQPMAGPLEGDEGLQFEYFCRDPSLGFVPMSAPVAGGALARIAAVRVSVATMGSTRSANLGYQHDDAVTVVFRNPPEEFCS